MEVILALVEVWALERHEVFKEHCQVMKSSGSSRCDGYCALHCGIFCGSFAC